MGIDVDFGKAYAKAAIAAGSRLPPAGSTVFITMTDRYKEAIVPAAKQLVDIGYKVIATSGTATALRAGGVECSDVLKIQEGRPNAADLMRNGEIDMMFITRSGDEPDVRDGKDLRRLALSLKVSIFFFIVKLFSSRRKKLTLFSLERTKTGPRHDHRRRRQGHRPGSGRDEGRSLEAGAHPGLLPGDGQARDQVCLRESFLFDFEVEFLEIGERKRGEKRESLIFLITIYFTFYFKCAAMLSFYLF